MEREHDAGREDRVEREQGETHAISLVRGGSAVGLPGPGSTWATGAAGRLGGMATPHETIARRVAALFAPMPEVVAAARRLCSRLPEGMAADLAELLAEGLVAG
jgi:hypothetical protein